MIFSSASHLIERAVTYNELTEESFTCLLSDAEIPCSTGGFLKGGLMVRRLFIALLIVLSSILLVASIVGIGAIWFYRIPFTQNIVARLQSVDTELSNAQTAIESAKAELERTLRLVDSAE